MRAAARPAAVCVEASDWVGTQPNAEYYRGLCATSSRLDPIKRIERKHLIVSLLICSFVLYAPNDIFTSTH